MWDFLKSNAKDGLEILILAVCIYQIYRAFRNTRGAQILVGLGAILVGLTLVAELAEFKVINWLITRAAALLAFALLVIFQPELRNALARLGSSRMFSFSSTRRVAFLERFADAVILLSKKRIGALFAIQRSISLKAHQDTGVRLDAHFSPELAISVFFPKTPLHDGGMIIADDRVAAAGCVFPVSQRELSDRSLGLRHRAGIGLGEESDAVVVIVSEETGSISICVDGEFHRNLTEKLFREKLAQIFLPKPSSDETESDQELDREDPVAPDRDRNLVSD
jgi:diadenylate cyclase